MNPWSWTVVSSARRISNGRVFSAIVKRKWPAQAPYIIQGKWVLTKSASEKSLLERLKVALVFAGSPNVMSEGQAKKDYRGERPTKAPIKQ